MRVAGIMSGTSLDGIDVAIVDIAGARVRTVAVRTTPFAEAIRRQILAVSNTNTTTRAVARLNFRLGELYARAAARMIERHGPVGLIGCHGQTIYHEGRVATMQIGEAAVIAERTGVPVVSDFRVRDIAAGGEGAPLVPFVDYLLFRHRKRTRVALNLGGIGNITVIPAGAQARQVIAFDTGPGNMVIDALVTEHTNGSQRFDRDGKIAARGRVRRALLEELLRDPYYRRKPPKSTGREQYGREFLSRLKARGVPMPDLIATATALTAATVAMAVEQATTGPVELIVSGGGAHNPCILGHLAALLPRAAVCTSADFGVDLDGKEAIAFAVLAYHTWRGKTSNLPSATGARRPVVLGKISFGAAR